MNVLYVSIVLDVKPTSNVLIVELGNVAMIGRFVLMKMNVVQKRDVKQTMIVLSVGLDNVAMIGRFVLIKMKVVYVLVLKVSNTLISRLMFIDKVVEAKSKLSTANSYDL